MIFLVVAPFTLRTAISLRRCSQLSVINEKDAEYGNQNTYH